MFNNKVLNRKTNFNNTMNILDLRARGIIYNFLLENQGLHFRELVRKLNIPRTTLSYHLRYLEKHDLLITKKESRYVRYFASQDIGNNEKTILSMIRQETTKNVLLYIVLMGAASQNEIAKELSIHPTTIEVHLKKLIKNGLIRPATTKDGIVYTNYSNSAIIERKPIKNEIIYITAGGTIYDFIIKYYKAKYLNDYISKTCLDLAEGIYPDGLPKKLKTLKWHVERAEKAIFEVFPHPYYA